MDLMKFSNEEFYAGRPDKATPARLLWDGLYYSMFVEFDSEGNLFAEMSSGNCEWRTPIEPASFKAGVNMALEDACVLGNAANFSRDPEQ